VIFALVFNIKTLTSAISNKAMPAVTAEGKPAPKRSWFWDKFNAAATLEQEKDVLLDHNYDGIQELDNSLPPWWKYGFYVTIVVACIYLYRFHISHDAPSSKEEFLAEMQKGEEQKAAYLAGSANNVDENTVTLLTDAMEIGAGKELFVKNCAPCHLPDGGGIVGPNLTDDYWLHGGGIKDVFKSIKYGWQDKGMKSWKDDFSPKQIQQLASFVKSLKGTHPATPKAPQGELYIEATPGGKAAADTSGKSADNLKPKPAIAENIQDKK
jgi:cytochrome c oxidase cbb3-type subunit 3